MSEPETLYYFGQLIDAFRYLRYEKNNLLHRDIKPENILVSHFG
jgi:serine/threonine protein kinase